MELSSLVLASAAVIAMAMVHTTAAQNSPQDFVSAHNAARAAAGVGCPVIWNATIAAYARNYANQRIRDCQLVHSGGPYGENIFYGRGANFTARDAVKEWVKEKRYYAYESDTCMAGQMCGHYTQVVWRRSTSIGCARVECDSGAIFITCNYYPQGNILGKRPW